MHEQWSAQRNLASWCQEWAKSNASRAAYTMFGELGFADSAVPGLETRMFGSDSDASRFLATDVSHVPQSLYDDWANMSAVHPGLEKRPFDEVRRGAAIRKTGHTFRCKGRWRADYF